ncbi:hypothetical protein SAMN02799616_03979 [Paenibacillus sp. UNC499MF]|nr:hypothetical protein SAMN02799616_03979 [Paenibacillus sp. UNC499MF]
MKRTGPIFTEPDPAVSACFRPSFRCLSGLSGNTFRLSPIRRLFPETGCQAGSPTFFPPAYMTFVMCPHDVYDYCAKAVLFIMKVE